MDFAMNLSAGSIFASLLVSSVGFVLFHFGRKQTRFPQLITGLVLMIFPVFVPQPAEMIGVASVCVGGLWLALRAGM